MQHLESLLSRRYDVIREIGRGGMGVVYLARQKSLGRQVAIKVLPPNYFEDDTMRQRFRREVDIMSRLSHPNIVTIYECEALEDGSAAIVMEFVGAATLDRVVGRDGLRDWKRLAHIARQIAAGLGHAHAHGIVHRDVKPANILVGHDDLVKIMDFGIAKADDSADLTRGCVIGTPAYMSPEQATGKKMTPATDIYSLGCVLYAAVCGNPPFRDSQSDNQLETLYKHINQSPEPLASVVKEVPRPLAALIHQMLAKSPGKRPQSCAEVAEALLEMERKNFVDSAAALTVVTDMAGALDRFRDDRLHLGDRVLLDIVIPGGSAVLTGHFIIGAILLLLNPLAFILPFPITLNVALRIAAVLVSFYLVKRGDLWGGLRDLWLYSRLPLCLVTAGGIGALACAASFETMALYLKSKPGSAPVRVSTGPAANEASAAGEIPVPDPVQPTREPGTTPGVPTGDTGETGPGVADPLETARDDASPPGGMEPANTGPDIAGPGPGNGSGDVIRNLFSDDITVAVATPTPAGSARSTPAAPVSPVETPRAAVVPDDPARLTGVVLVELMDETRGRDNMDTLERMLEVLHGEQSPSLEHLTARVFLGQAMFLADARAYRARTAGTGGWQTWENDLDGWRGRLSAAREENDALQLALAVILAQPFAATARLTRPRELAREFPAPPRLDQVERALASPDEDPRYAALAIIRHWDRPALTPHVARQLEFEAASLARARLIRDEALLWLEAHGDETMLAPVRAALARPEINHGDHARLQTLLERHGGERGRD